MGPQSRKPIVTRTVIPGPSYHIPRVDDGLKVRLRTPERSEGSPLLRQVYLVRLRVGVWVFGSRPGNLKRREPGTLHRRDVRENSREDFGPTTVGDTE